MFLLKNYIYKLCSYGEAAVFVAAGMPEKFPTMDRVSRVKTKTTDGLHLESKHIQMLSN